MKKISKKLSLNRETVRVLSNSDLSGVAGGGAEPTTTVLRHHSVAADAAVRCVSNTIMKVPPPAFVKP
ncbi:MAG TPA: class I lanthipeptide [Kofleriaceae bacterium]|nr:class I lanthipeptide [Kofleriaceae bacterium]